MPKKLILTGILFILLLTMGCTLQDPRSNPSYSVFPEILVDYDIDSEETKIWVKSALSDFKYDQIRYEILSDEGQKNYIIQENNTYCLPYSTKSTSFNLTISVLSEEKEFGFNCRIETEQTAEYLIRVIIYEEGEEIEEILKIDDLPYKKVLEEL
jgi:hypothetical protein